MKNDAKKFWIVIGCLGTCVLFLFLFCLWWYSHSIEGLTSLSKWKVTIDKSVEQIYSAISETEATKKHRDEDNGLLYWQEHIDQKCKQIWSILLETGRDKSAFLWYTDAHWSYSNQKSPTLLKYLCDHTPINRVNFGGDIIAVESDSLDEMRYIWEWRDQIRELPNHHSVPGNHDDGNSVDGRYSEEYIYTYLLASEETPDVVRGSEGLYYYIDVPSEKTRYLYLDTATSQGMIIRDEKQKKWLCESLLTVPDEWHIVAIAHIWRNVDYHHEPPVDDGFSLGGEFCLNEFDAYNERRGMYSECNGRVEFCIGGHTHVDGDFRSQGGIPVIITETDSSVIRSGLESVPGTVSEASVNAVIADYKARKVFIIRVGRGKDRIVSLEE